MSKSSENISFDPKPLKEGGGWYIVVTYRGGPPGSGYNATSPEPYACPFGNGD